MQTIPLQSVTDYHSVNELYDKSDNATSHPLFLPHDLYRAIFLGFLEVTSLC